MALGYQDDLTLVLICLISTIFIIKLIHKSTTTASPNLPLPPGPFGLPIIGHLHLLAPLPHQALHKISIRYGPLFRFFMGSTPCVVASSPEMAKEILKKNENAVLDRPYNMSAKYLTYGGKGFIFAPYGPYWKFMKKMIVSQLLNGSTLDSLFLVRSHEIQRFIEYLSNKAKVGESVELEVELMRMMSNVISRMLASKRCSEAEGNIRNITMEFNDLLGTFNVSDYIWLCKNIDLQGIRKRLKDVHKRFDALMEGIMREREEKRKQKKETGEVKDLLDILLDISEQESMEIKLTRENIKAFIQEIFSGGTDTSAITIQWALSELINHPNIMRKAVEEINQVVGKNRLVQESDIPNLPYLQAIVKEALRLHPTGSLIYRRSIQDFTIGGYHIPAKTNVFINLWAIGRDPNHWEHPLEFRPERFEEKQLDVRGQHFELLPFGSGRRMCPGTSLGLMVVHVTLASMIQCFDWRAGKDGNLSKVDMEEGTGLTLPRANPLVCVPVARLDPIPLLSM